jgi:uncharacterized protein
MKRGIEMLKRKYGDRSGWKRVLKSQYAQSFLDTKGFTGYVTLLKIEKVTEPLYVSYEGKTICIADNEYIWLQHFPLNKHHSVTTMFNSNGEIVQWYIDICVENGVEKNIPWMDDLFLDIVVLPTGEVIQKDADELEEALSKGVIDESLYHLAWTEANFLTHLIKNNHFDLIKQSKSHKEILLKELVT